MKNQRCKQKNILEIKWSPYSVPEIIYEEEKEVEEEEYFEIEFDIECKVGRIRKKDNRTIRQNQKTRSTIGNIVKSHMETNRENNSITAINIKNVLQTDPFVKIHIKRRELKRQIHKTERLFDNFESQKDNINEKLKQRNILRHSEAEPVIKQKKIKKKEILQLQYRELTPEDYETLLTLDDKVKKKTTNKSFVKSLCSQESAIIKEDILINDILCENKIHNELLYRDITPEDYDILLTLDDSLESKLTDKSIVENLTQQTKINSLTEKCVICMTDIKHNDSLAVLPLCGHRFHTQCILKWLLNCSQQCPIDMGYVQ